VPVDNKCPVSSGWQQWDESLMTYFFCDIKILCVQNNKAHFLFNIKLNGHLTYKSRGAKRNGKEEEEEKALCQSMQLLIS
jgi:hypothetical protein